MASLTKFYQFTLDCIKKVHNLGTSSDQLMIALSNTAPAQTNTVLANITEISYTNLSGNPTSRQCTIGTCGLNGSNQAYIKIADITLTCGASAMPTFRYVVLYNDTPTSPVDPLIGWYDYGVGGVTLNPAETFKVDFDDTNGVFTLA